MDNVEQRSDEWHKMRLGKVTASKVADIIAKTKSGYAATRANYAAQLVTERLTGVHSEGFTNAAMQWGTDMEPEARAAYEFNRAEKVEEIAFVLHPNIGDTGASPDGLVGTDGLLEIKCPNSATHIATLKGASIDGKYITQMQWQMACTGRKWCDFVSYDPRLPDWCRFFCQRVPRDDDMIAELEKEVVEFLKEVRASVDEIRRRYEPQDRDPSSDILMAC